VIGRPLAAGGHEAGFRTAAFWDTGIHRLSGALTGGFPYPDPAKTEESFSAPPSRSPASRARAATNCAPPRASLGCGSSRAGGARHASCSRPSTARSPKASTPRKT
jgi:hypothetical protein